MEYITVKKSADDLGSSFFSEDVFADIAAVALTKNKNIALAKKDKNAVDCKIKAGNITLTSAVKMKLGSNVVEECEKMQQKIHDDILEMTDVECKDIRLDVVGFIVDEKKAK